MLLILSRGLAMGASDTDSQVFRLFSFHSKERSDLDEALHFYENRKAVTRFAEVTVNENLKTSTALNQGDRVVLNVFDKDCVSVIIERTGVNVNGTFYFSGLAEEARGYFVLATTGNRSLGNLFLPREGLFYKIISDPCSQRHYLLEMDAHHRDILEGSPPLAPPEKPAKMQKSYTPQHYNIPSQQPLKETQEVSIEILVVYTPAAKEWADNHGGGIDNVIAVSMANTQLVHDNSNTFVTVPLAFSSLVDYIETGNTQIDLWRLVASPGYNPFGISVWGGYGIPGYMDDVHDLRNSYYADLCVLFTYTHDTGGLAQQLTDRQGQSHQAFSIVRVQQAAHSYTQAHEMGHNMGCHHHKEQKTQPGPTRWLNWPENQWSAGWRWQSDEGHHYCSVMTYESGHFFDDGITHTRIPLFSSPNILYHGHPAGHPDDGDNVRTIHETKHTVSNYRVPGMALVSTRQITEVELFSAVSGGKVITGNDHPVSQCGLVWNTEPYPSLENHAGMTQESCGDGNFTSLITNIDHSTGYYVSAYAKNAIGTAYGNQRFFQTPQPILAQVSTTPAGSVGYNAATTGGNVTGGGNSEVYQRGIVWSKQLNPTITAHEGITRDGTGTGGFNSKMNDLTPGSRYFYRAYASNVAGTNYGVQHTLTTPIANIFPNPFSEKVEIAFYNENHKDVTIVLRNMHGQKVKKWRVGHYGNVHKTLNLSHLNNGLYLLSIQSEQHFPVWPLIKTDF